MVKVKINNKTYIKFYNCKWQAVSCTEALSQYGSDYGSKFSQKCK